jgi:hypothetical protein
MLFTIKPGRPVGIDAHQSRLNEVVDPEKWPITALSVHHQCAISTGKVMDRSTVREVPPNTHSRARLCP